MNGLEIETASGPRTLRRLGLGDLEFARDLVESVLSAGEVVVRVLHRVDLRNPADLLAVVLAGGKAAQRPLHRWIASLLNMPLEDVQDPEKFDLDDLGKLFEAMGKHPNIQSFFARLSRLWPGLLAWLQTIAPDSSTASNSGTDGPTPT